MGLFSSSLFGETSGAGNDVIITGMPDVGTDATTAVFYFTIASGTAEYSLDGAAYVATTSPLTLTDLAVGGHVVIIRSDTDLTTLQSFVWEVTGDASVPAIEVAVVSTEPDPVDHVTAALSRLPWYARGDA